MPRFPAAAPSAEGLSDRVFSGLLERARQLPGPVYPLHVGDTYLEPPAPSRAEAQLSSQHPRLHNYAPVQGEPALLDAIQTKLARRHGVQVPREQLQVMAGATSGLGVVCTALLSPGDEVILPAPFWPLIRGIIRARGALPVEVPLYTRLDQPGFDPVAAVEQAITPRTVALYLNSPHNPSGTILSDSLQRRLGELAERHALWILTDEVYEDLYYTPQPPEPLWKDARLRERCVATHSVSKAYGLAGSRVGYTHGPAHVMPTIRGVQTFFTYCAPRPLQLGAARALVEGDDWLAHVRGVYAKAARSAAEALDLPVPAGGSFLFFEAAPYLRRGEAMPEFLLRVLEGGVMLTPGSAAGSDYERWVRLCFTSVPQAELDAALERLRSVLRS
jgi:N-succinyldiaminopimelate aminotransferase